MEDNIMSAQLYKNTAVLWQLYTYGTPTFGFWRNLDK